MVIYGYNRGRKITNQSNSLYENTSLIMFSTLYPTPSSLKILPPRSTKESASRVCSAKVINPAKWLQTIHQTIKPN